MLDPKHFPLPEYHTIWHPGAIVLLYPPPPLNAAQSSVHGCKLFYKYLKRRRLIKILFHLIMNINNFDIIITLCIRNILVCHFKLKNTALEYN